VFPSDAQAKQFYDRFPGVATLTRDTVEVFEAEDVAGRMAPAFGGKAWQLFPASKWWK
jgi:hypothetical protein